MPFISAWFKNYKAEANHTHNAIPNIKIENNNYDNDIEFVSGSNTTITTSASGIVINQVQDTSSSPIKAIENANNGELAMTVNISNNVMSESNSINFGGSF
jgi:hypothetical protein